MSQEYHYIIKNNYPDLATTYFTNEVAPKYADKLEENYLGIKQSDDDAFLDPEEGVIV